MPVPSAAEIRDYLEGYRVKTTSTVSITGDVTSASAVITAISPNTDALKPLMRVAGAGIPVGARILSVDSPTQVTLDVVATATAAAVALTVTFFTSVTDDWITQRRDRLVVPWIEKTTGQSFSAVKQAVEYYSGNGGSVLIVDRRPIVALVDVSVVAGVELFLGVSVSNIEVIADEGILKAKGVTEESARPAAFPRGTKNIKVTYTYGFADMPDEIAEAVTYLTCHAILGHIANQTGGGALTLQSFGRNYGDRGKFSNERKELSAKAMGILNGSFALGAVGG